MGWGFTIDSVPFALKRQLVLADLLTRKSRLAENITFS